MAVTAPDGPAEVGLRVVGLASDPLGRYLAGALDGEVARVILWDTQSYRRVAEIAHAEPVRSIRFTSDGSRLISISLDGERGRAIVTPLAGGDSYTIALSCVKLAAVHPSGRFLVGTNSCQRLLVVDLSSGLVKHEFEAPFGAVAFDRYFAAPETEAAIRKTMKDLRLGFARHEKLGGDQLYPPGSLNAYMKETERAYRERLLALRDRAIRQGPPGGVHVIRFDTSGERIFLATMNGLKVYSWNELEMAVESLPEPQAQLSLPVPDATMRTCDEDVYDLALDSDRSRILIAGGDGRVHFLDLTTNRSGVLIQTSGLPPVRSLRLSRDRSALAVILDLAPVLPPRASRGLLLQVWDYRSLINEN